MCLDDPSLDCDSTRIFSFTASATNENVPDGAIQSFTVGSEAALTLVDTVSSGGSGPPYCAGLSTGQVAVANVRVFTISHNRSVDHFIVWLWYGTCCPYQGSQLAFLQ